MAGRRACRSLREFPGEAVEDLRRAVERRAKPPCTSGTLSMMRFGRSVGSRRAVLIGDRFSSTHDSHWPTAWPSNVR